MFSPIMKRNYESLAYFKNYCLILWHRNKQPPDLKYSELFSAFSFSNVINLFEVAPITYILQVHGDEFTNFLQLEVTIQLLLLLLLLLELSLLRQQQLPRQPHRNAQGGHVALVI